MVLGFILVICSFVLKESTCALASCFASHLPPLSFYAYSLCSLVFLQLISHCVFNRSVSLFQFSGCPCLSPGSLCSLCVLRVAAFALICCLLVFYYFLDSYQPSSCLPFVLWKSALFNWSSLLWFSQPALVLFVC